MAARDHVFATYKAAGVQYMVRTNDWKYIVTIPYEGNNTYELYNLTKDPAEMNNLYGRYPEIERELALLLASCS